MLVAAFALTVIVEGVIAAAILRHFHWLETAAIQLTTWPIAQSIAWRTDAFTNTNAFWLLELGVAVTETALWRMALPIPLRRAATISFIANGVTATIAWFAR
jgi:hypothetical protein